MEFMQRKSIRTVLLFAAAVAAGLLLVLLVRLVSGNAALPQATNSAMHLAERAEALFDRNYKPIPNTNPQKFTTAFDAFTDLANNRTKRIFNDRTSARRGSNTKPFLLQTYKRDTGEVIHDLSVPIYVAGRHWGGFRVGYRPTQMVPAATAKSNGPAMQKPGRDWENHECKRGSLIDTIRSSDEGERLT